MRRALAILTIAVLLAGCAPKQTEPFPTEVTLLDSSGYVVDGIMEYPDYTFDGTPTTDELRQTAVRAFRDLLTVRWSTIAPIIYEKAGPVSGKTFTHQPDVTYAGTLYSNANAGLFQFLEYYDFDTGRLNYPGDTKDLKRDLGAACADAMLWGVATVCNSFDGAYYPVTMVYKNGYLPVGDYTYDFTIDNYNDLPTYRIVESNGPEIMLDAYSKMLPADMLTSTPDNHGMMVIEAPTVVYKEDGSIDPDKSIVLIQDQRAGSGDGFYEVEEDGQILQYSGRTSAEFTFARLLERSYLPVTTAEFIGEKAYEAATAELDRECKSVSALTEATVKCNYPLAVVCVTVTEASGKSHTIGRQLFSGKKQPGVPRTFKLSDLECLADFTNSPYNIAGCTLSIQVVPATGDRITVASIPLTGK